MEFILLAALGVLVAFLVFGIIFHILKTVIKVFMFISLALLVAGGIFAGYAYLEMREFRTDMAEGNVAFVLQEQGSELTAVIPEKGEDISIPDADDLPEVEHIFIFDLEAFRTIDPNAYAIVQKENYDEADLPYIFANMVSDAIRKTSGKFVIQAYLDGNLVMRPELRSMQFLKRIPGVSHFL